MKKSPFRALLVLPFLLSSCGEDVVEDKSDPEPKAAKAEQPKGEKKGDGKGKGRPGGGLADELLSKYDADVDGAISDFEVDEPTWQFIARADANGDSKVSREEFANLRPQRPEGSGQGQPGQPGQGKGGKGRFRPDPSQFISQFDKSGDGALTKDEVPEFMWERMSAADGNGDGAITLEEFQARRAAREAERAANGGGFGGFGQGGGKGGGKGKGGGGDPSP